MIWSHSAPARTVRYTHRSSSRWRAPAASRSGAGGALCTSSHSALSRTAATKASVTATERLKLVSRPSSLAWMNASMSGWSQRSIPICAPRREPADSTVAQLWSNTRMYDSGPLARLLVPRTCAPCGRMLEKS